jgi:hypothetical protein
MIHPLDASTLPEPKLGQGSPCMLFLAHGMRSEEELKKCQFGTVENLKIMTSHVKYFCSQHSSFIAFLLVQASTTRGYQLSLTAIAGIYLTVRSYCIEEHLLDNRQRVRDDAACFTGLPRTGSHYPTAGSAKAPPISWASIPVSNPEGYNMRVHWFYDFHSHSPRPRGE